MAKAGKKYRAGVEKIEDGKFYSPLSAIRLAKEIAPAQFDETLEVHFRLGIDTRQADQQVRGSISLPNGTGKSVRVAVFAEGDKADEAREAGAEFVGGDDLVAQIQGGFLDFDAAVATPKHDGQGRSSWQDPRPHGLMPNPKLGTVTNDVAKIVGELKAGRVEYRADRYGICHVPFGKASFEEAKLVENYGSLLDEILRVKPATAKGRYIKSITIASTMGPGIPVNSTKTRNLMMEDSDEQ